jgi:hypothetical protein
VRQLGTHGAEREELVLEAAAVLVLDQARDIQLREALLQGRHPRLGTQTPRLRIHLRSPVRPPPFLPLLPLFSVNTFVTPSIAGLLRLGTLGQLSLRCGFGRADR